LLDTLFVDLLHIVHTLGSILYSVILNQALFG
jgi:hypothetical protein